MCCFGRTKSNQVGLLLILPASKTKRLTVTSPGIRTTWERRPSFPGFSQPESAWPRCAAPPRPPAHSLAALRHTRAYSGGPTRLAATRSAVGLALLLPTTIWQPPTSCAGEAQQRPGEHRGHGQHQPRVAPGIGWPPRVASVTASPRRRSGAADRQQLLTATVALAVGQNVAAACELGTATLRARPSMRS